MNTLDSVQTTLEHRKILEKNIFLRKLYRDFYSFFSVHSENCITGERLELGSGAGFLKEQLPGIKTSDVVAIDGLDMVCSALSLPFKDNSLAAICLLNVFHHLRDAEAFLSEAQRCLKPNGQILMIEPANTCFSRLIYKNLHHEPFLPHAEDWRLSGTGRLSDANIALPWIVLKRDYSRFCREFPGLSLVKYRNFCPFRYLLSGGFSFPQIAPGWSYSFILALERLLERLRINCGMFTEIIIRKK